MFYGDDWFGMASLAQFGPLEGGRPGGRLLRLAVSCPGCGSRPALRVTECAVRAVLELPPAARLGTYQCQRRRCGVVYDLTVAAYLRAS
jgi:hypothetical protein